MAQAPRARLLEEIAQLRRQLAERDAQIESLRQSEARFRLMAEATNDLISLTTVTGEKLYASPSYQHFTGYAPDEVLNTPFHIRVHPDDLEFVKQARAANLRGASTQIEYRCLRKDGSHFWLDVRATPIPVADGGPGTILRCARDISDRKRAEESLQTSDRRFRALVENAFDVIAIVDANGAIIYESPSAAQMAGWSERGPGRNCFRHVHPEDLEGTRRLFGELVSHPGAIVRAIQLRIRNPNGEERWLEVSGGNRLHDPAVNGIVVNWRDITE